MPQVQVVDTTERAPEPTGVEQFFSKLGKSYKDENDRVEIGKILDEYKANREDANAWENAQLDLEKSNISPSRRLETQKSLNETKKLLIEKDKALNAKVNKGILTQEEKERQKANLLKAGWPEHAADQYLDAPPGVKGTLEREHAALAERGLRKPLVSVPDGVDTNRPSTAPEATVAEDEWPAPITPRNLNEAERVKWENGNQKENNAELKDTQNKKKAYRTNDRLINSMTQINDGKYLPEGLGKFIKLDPKTGDLRTTTKALEAANPQTQLYIKNLAEWQKGAKEIYGARITNFDLQSFMAMLPTLANSEQGRRLILKQMKYVNDLESSYNSTLNEGLKKYGRDANYNQILDVVDKKVAGKEEELLGKIDNLVLASRDIELMSENPEKFKNHVLMQTPEGSFRAVPRDKVEALKKKNWRDF